MSLWTNKGNDQYIEKEISSSFHHRHLTNSSELSFGAMLAYPVRFDDKLVAPHCKTALFRRVEGQGPNPC